MPAPPHAASGSVNGRGHLIPAGAVGIRLPAWLQERLGHASIAETMDTYGHLYPSGLDVGRGAIDAHYAAALAEAL